MRILFVFAVFLSLAGCGSYQWSQFEKSVDDLDGKTVQEVSAELGYPTGRRQVEGMDLMYWDATGITDEMMTADGVTARELANRTKRMCRITFQIMDGNVLRNPQIQGNNRACIGYIRSLRTFHSHNPPSMNRSIYQ